MTTIQPDYFTAYSSVKMTRDVKAYSSWSPLARRIADVHCTRPHRLRRRVLSHRAGSCEYGRHLHGNRRPFIAGSRDPIESSDVESGAVRTTIAFAK
jgi:hypothetical protein